MKERHPRKGKDVTKAPESDEVQEDQAVDDSEGQDVAGGARGVAVGSIIRGGGKGG